jgi:hypothetical protein
VERIDEDIYAAQRDELLTLLRKMKSTGEGLVVHGRAVLSSDDAAAVLQKLGRGLGFSRRERSALTEAGFDLESLYPGR